jgi:hypothetical protein
MFTSSPRSVSFSIANCSAWHKKYQKYRQPTRCCNNGLLIIPISSTSFGRWLRPSSGALDCGYSLWYNAPTMLPAGSLEAEFLCFLIGIINKLLLLHLVGCLHYLCVCVSGSWTYWFVNRTKIPEGWNDSDWWAWQKTDYQSQQFVGYTFNVTSFCVSKLWSYLFS